MAQTIATKRRARPNSNTGMLLVEHCKDFAQITRPKTPEIDRLKELFNAFIHNTGPEMRRQISVTLARSPYTPRAIAIFMSMQDAAIATPVLLYSPVLTSRDLVTLIEKLSHEHAQVIARRHNLEEQVIHRLLQEDDETSSLRKLLSQHPVMKREQIASRKIHSAHQDYQQDNDRKSFQPAYYTGRPSEPSAVGIEQTEVTNAAALKIVSGSDTIKRAAIEPTKSDLSNQLLSLAKRGQRVAEKLDPNAPLFTPDDPAMLCSKLIEMVRQNKMDRFSRTLKNECNVDQDLVGKLIEEDNPGGLACLFRALDFSRTQAGRLLLMMVPRLGRNADVYRQVMDRYEQQTLDSAKLEINTITGRSRTDRTARNTEVRKGDLHRVMENRRISIRHNGTRKTAGNHNQIGKTG
ncbi:MAG: DUF2336 domain-containing protein [Pseudomonadota bacterium]